MLQGSLYEDIQCQSRWAVWHYFGEREKSLSLPNFPNLPFRFPERSVALQRSTDIPTTNCYHKMLFYPGIFHVYGFTKLTDFLIAENVSTLLRLFKDHRHHTKTFCQHLQSYYTLFFPSFLQKYTMLLHFRITENKIEFLKMIAMDFSPLFLYCCF